MKGFFVACFIALSLLARAQEEHDSLRTKQLGEIVIQSKCLSDVERLPKVQCTHLWSGKKNEVINVQNLNLNIAEKTPRQIFAR